MDSTSDEELRPTTPALSPRVGSVWTSKQHAGSEATIVSCRNGWVEYIISAAPAHLSDQLGYGGGASVEEFTDFFSPNTTESDEELRSMLLTCDGCGKKAKTKALEILLRRCSQKDLKDIPASYYLPDL